MKNGISQLCNAFLLSLDSSEITYMQIQPLTDNWQFHQEETVEWLPAKVPGSVHTDLMASGCSSTVNLALTGSMPSDEPFLTPVA